MMFNLFMFEVMEERHQWNRTFMAQCRALRDHPTVSSHHHAALLVVSSHIFIALWPYCLGGYLHYTYLRN